MVQKAVCATCIPGTNRICQRLEIVPSRVHFSGEKAVFEVGRDKIRTFVRRSVREENKDLADLQDFVIKIRKKRTPTLYLESFAMCWLSRNKTQDFGEIMNSYHFFAFLFPLLAVPLTSSW